MTRPAETKITAGHKALAAYIDKHFEGIKDHAARAALADGFPTTGEPCKRFESIRQQLRNLVNGHVHQPALDRMLWFQENWGIRVDSWSKD